MADLPTEFVIQVLQEPARLYRACFGEDAAAVETGLRSNYENRRQPPHPADLHATVLHMAVSMFDRSDTVIRMARRRPDRIGTHVITVDLEPGHAVCLADTGGAGHWSVWGVPSQLLRFVTDVQAVQ